MRRVKKLVPVLLSVAAIYYFVVASIGLLAHPENADIAVVLGNEVLANGQPSDRLAARVDCAIALYKEKKIPLIMVSGGKGLNGFDEATVMAKHLVENDIPPSAIIIDSEGINTMATATNTAKLMKERNFKTAIIVTQYFHIPRTELAFHMAGITHFSADFPHFFEWRDIPSTFREMIAIPVYWASKPHSLR